ncbi:MAG TPA: K(+)-transporting ATPase subunit C [Conexibacter sp.]|nr:K(+)-transporting ATPase subunit C [Conexibacter sp.]
MSLRRELTTSLIAVVLFTLLLGGVYPLGVWAVGQVAFPGSAGGSLVHVDGRLVGSSLIGQDFSTGRRAAAYFQSRPSQDGYDAAATSFSNRGPNQASAVAFYRRQLAAYVKREGRYDPGLTAAQVPVDAVTTSGSGVDPHISPADARIQAHRVAAVRKLPLARVNRLIDEHTDGRFAGFLGEPGVNVLMLDLALDAEAR